MSRVQLALNVDNLAESVDFYTKLFATAPAKQRPGYANFAIAEPPLKLVLIENPGRGASLNHLGVEVETTDEVTSTTARLTADGLDTATEDQVTCCYAVQDKVWVTAPDGNRWEVYTVLADAGTEAEQVATADGACGPGSCATVPAGIAATTDTADRPISEECCAG